MNPKRGTASKTVILMHKVIFAMTDNHIELGSLDQTQRIESHQTNSKD